MVFRALYIRGSDFETSDAVFGVKESLLVSLGQVSTQQTLKYGVAADVKLLQYDFVLVTAKETEELRNANAIEAMEAQGRKMKLWNGLPVPDVD